MGRNYYLILGVDQDATQEEIRSAYRNLAKRKHPDQNEQAGATQTFQLINEAYNVLGDPAARAEYDRQYFSDGAENNKSEGKSSKRGKSDAGVGQRRRSQENQTRNTTKTDWSERYGPTAHTRESKESYFLYNGEDTPDPAPPIDTGDQAVWARGIAYLLVSIPLFYISVIGMFHILPWGVGGYFGQINASWWQTFFLVALAFFLLVAVSERILQTERDIFSAILK